jgi:uncharacterized protein YprB with RNaseH-like and TPR domain
MTEQLRCVHRHSIEEHPSCFAMNKVVRKPVLAKAKSVVPWWKEADIKIGYLDIETSNLEADWGVMLSWAIKERNGKTASDFITKDELFSGADDKRIVTSILEEMRKYDILVTYYGTGFDLPYIRSRALLYKLNPPTYGENYHFDLYYTVRSKLRLKSNSLFSVCNFFNIKGKGKVDGKLWSKARYGNYEALQEVLKHNIEDVIALEKVHKIMERFQKWMKKSV